MPVEARSSNGLVCSISAAGRLRTGCSGLTRDLGRMAHLMRAKQAAGPGGAGERPQGGGDGLCAVVANGWALKWSTLTAGAIRLGCPPLAALGAPAQASGAAAAAAGVVL